MLSATRPMINCELQITNYEKFSRLLIGGISLFIFFASFSANAKFADVDVTHPYWHSIDELQKNGVVEGHEVGQARMFFPLSKINRAEALKLILLSTETLADTQSGEIFPDVLPEQWFANYVNTAYQLGIVEGFPEGDFRPAAKVLRAEFVKMLFETLEVPVPDPVGEEAWYDPYFMVADEYRLLPSSQDASEELSRGEAAEIIYRTQQVAAGDFTRKYVFSGSGLVSYYNEGFAGRPTASGEIYDPFDLTAAHRTLPFGTRLKVSNQQGDFVVVRVNDRGPYHKNRVLDLSQAAFERLGSIGTGVLAVNFELFSDPEDQVKAIPEAIRPLLSDTTRQADVPESVVEQLRESPEESETLSGVAREVKAVIPEKSVMYDQPIFGESAASISTDFFPDVELRQTLAQKLPQGFVTQVAGKTTGTERYKEVTVFMQNQRTGEQKHFTAPVSGTNFTVSVAFFETGTFDLGLVFDDQRQSRVAEIEVAAYPRERKLPASDVSFATNLEVSVVPEDKQVHFRWASSADRITKMTFSQGEFKQNVVFENGLGFFAFDSAWFDGAFDLNKHLTIEVYQALSEDGTLFKQRTNWKPVTYKNFDLVRGFPDFENEAVRMNQFQRYYRSPQKIAVEGYMINEDYTVSDTLYVITPEGLVETTSVWRNGLNFKAQFEAQTDGRYVLEVISEAGDILFNRAVYIAQDPVLPVMAHKQTVVTQNSSPAIYNWINRIRDNHEINELLSSNELHEVAQAYADRMAEEGFLSHYDSQGNGPAERLDHLTLRSFAENISYGSTLNLALEGLENSGSHRKNILSTRWSRMGVGLAQNDEGEFYVVQLFAS